MNGDSSYPGRPLRELDRGLAAEQAPLPRGVGDAYAAARCLPPVLGEPAGPLWHEERPAPERPCARCGATTGPCLASGAVNE